LIASALPKTSFSAFLHLKGFQSKISAIFGNFGISGNVLICAHQRKSAAKT